MESGSIFETNKLKSEEATVSLIRILSFEQIRQVFQEYKKSVASLDFKGYPNGDTDLVRYLRAYKFDIAKTVEFTKSAIVII
jgi:hypothetical protein